jgi:WD40 repeat protein
VLVSETIPLDGSPAAATPLDPARLKTPVSVFAAGPTGPALLMPAIIPMPGQRLVSPMALAASPDGKILAIAGLVTYAPGPMNPKLKQVGAVMLWDVAGNQEKALLLGHSGPVIAVAFSSDGKTLASASFGFDKSIKLWDLAAARERTTLRGHTAPVSSFAFSADGKRLASGAVDGIVKIWDPAASHLELSCKGHVLPVISLAWTPDSKTLLSGSMDGQVKVWDLADLGPSTVKGFEGVVSALAFTSDSAAVAGVDRRGTLLVSDVATGVLRARHKLGGQGIATCAAFSPDAKIVATGGPMAAVDLYHVAGGQKLRSLPGHAGVVCALSFAPDGQILAVGTGQSQKFGEIKLWNPHTGKELATLGCYGHDVLTLAWSADGKRLAGARDARVKVWDAATAKELVSFQAAGEKKEGNPPRQGWYEESGSVKALAFSPDGQLLAVAMGPTITLREVSTGKVRITIQGYSHRSDSLAFSPDGRRLASGGGARELGRGGGFKLWDTTTGLEVLTLGDPSDAISCVTFSPDGGRLAASPVLGTVVPFLNQSSGEITLWDGRPVAKK